MDIIMSGEIVINGYPPCEQCDTQGCHTYNPYCKALYLICPFNT